jgi:uncharacterized damage-inducible protein DinB
MKKTVWYPAIVLCFGLSCIAARAQQPNKPEEKPAIASVLDRQLSIVESEFVGAAEAMPEEKYSFAPTAGEFKGVRTFAEQVKHVATANHIFFGAILGEKHEPGPGENGPDAIKTKDEILKYLRDSFALGHRAIATITAENVVTPVKNPPNPVLNTPLALASIGCWHSFDHYGQMVEYLRMNGIVPPASRPRPKPAN